MLGGAGGFEGAMAGAAFVGASSAALRGSSNRLSRILVFMLAIAIVKVWPQGLLSRWRT
jgi:ABC-type branched-subunit amino acid transport system permease subunit